MIMESSRCQRYSRVIFDEFQVCLYLVYRHLWSIIIIINFIKPNRVRIIIHCAAISNQLVRGNFCILLFKFFLHFCMNNKWGGNENVFSMIRKNVFAKWHYSMYITNNHRVWWWWSNKCVNGSIIIIFFHYR